MYPIRIISPQFVMLGEIDRYESLQFTRRFYRPGEFEVHVSVDTQYADTLQEDNIILLGSNTHKAGIIESISIELNNKGIETCVAKGKTLNGVLARRITVPGAGGYDRILGSAETVMKHYINNNSVNPDDINRTIPNLINILDNGRGKNTPWQSRFENLSDVLQQIAEFCDIGWEVYLDIVNHKWLFDVIEGRDLTVMQDVLPPVIFSTEFSNVQTQKYVKDGANEKNVGYAGGKGEEEERLIMQVGNAQGLSRKEVFLDCSDAEDAAELENSGAQKLAEYKRIQTLETEIIHNNSFIYGKDYDLGDKVTIQNKKWGLIMHTRLTEVKEIYEPGGFKLEGTFGDSIPTLGKKLKLATQKPIK